ncbi:MAG: ABC transporter permease [Chloroflexi bacterium]|nr:ABC transporter permease [Chloroflexota bacterium]
MNKILNIAWKDLTVTFRDPTALAVMLVTPFALTLAIAFAFGGLTGGGGSSGLSNIPVVIVNHDTGEFGTFLVETFKSEELANLVEPTFMSDDAAARATVDADETAAAIIVPANFSESIVPAGLMPDDSPTTLERQESAIEIYANPTQPISAGVIQGIVDEFISRVMTGLAGGQVSIVQLIASGLIPPLQAESLGREIGGRTGEHAAGGGLIAIKGEMGTERESQDFDWLTYMGPSMAVMFLMFTATAGGRKILAEQSAGTLPRLLTTPTLAAQVLGGKMFGIYLTGLAQLTILIGASGLLFGARWGSPGPLVLVVMALVAAATGWGILMAAVARTPGQANAIGTALSLTFGALAGNFIPRQTLPQWMQTISYVTPNAWALEAFNTLTAGGDLADVTGFIVALLVMAGVLFGVAVLAFRRRST